MPLTETKLHSGGVIRKQQHPTPEPLPAPDPLYSRLEFLGRFTDAEVATIMGY